MNFILNIILSIWGVFSKTYLFLVLCAAFVICGNAFANFYGYFQNNSKYFVEVKQMADNKGGGNLYLKVNGNAPYCAHANGGVITNGEISYNGDFCYILPYTTADAVWTTTGYKSHDELGFYLVNSLGKVLTDPDLYVFNGDSTWGEPLSSEFSGTAGPCHLFPVGNFSYATPKPLDVQDSPCHGAEYDDGNNIIINDGN
jgi:hypothetical protein